MKSPTPVGSCLSCKCKTRLKVFAMDKHSSLFWRSIIGEEKSFIATEKCPYLAMVIISSQMTFGYKLLSAVALESPI
jgi:hypothetical protein